MKILAIHDEYIHRFVAELLCTREAAETGADYMLQGGIKTIIDQEGKESVKFYQVDLELVHLDLIHILTIRLDHGHRHAGNADVEDVDTDGDDASSYWTVSTYSP